MSGMEVEKRARTKIFYLYDEDILKLREIAKSKHMHSASEAIRFCIKFTYESLFKGKGESDE